MGLLNGQYGQFWFGADSIDVEMTSDPEKAFEFSVGQYEFSTNRYGSGFDFGVGDMFFAGFGTLSNDEVSEQVQFFIASTFDVESANYEMVISNVVPVPLPANAVLMASMVTILAFARFSWRPLTAGRE